MEFGVFPVLLHDAQTSSLEEKEKDAPILLAEDGAEKAAKLQVARSDRVTNAEIRNTTNMKDVVAVAPWSQVELRRPCSRNRAAQMGTWIINVGCKIKQRENRATEETFKTVTGEG
jgi:hypothetical protein